MKSIKKTSKEWCSEHSNKGCKEQCDGCWQVKQPWGGCEQYNMELAYEAGANAVLDLLQKRLSDRHFTSAAFLQIDIEDFIKELKML